MEDIKTISYESEHYPPLLREITQAPTQLYVRGNIELLQYEPMLAVVGSRKASPYGRQCIDYLLSPLVQAKVPLVSGLAYGIDSLAHKLCLKHTTPTIAILGSGLDDVSIYPKTHISLAHDIIKQGGTLVSEYPPNAPAYQSNFPARNRIIAGLCQATLVIQAAKKSGSLITARLALEYGRDVLAVPGAINAPLSIGTNTLIRDGATPVIEPDDILTAFDISKNDQQQTLVTTLTPNQHVILDLLSEQPQHIDYIAEQSHLPVNNLSVILTELELTGLAQSVGGMKYIKIK